MKNFVYFFSLVLFLTTSVNAQTSEQLYLEEYGNAPGIINLEAPLNAPSTWTQVAAAPNVYGRVVAGAIGNYLYIFCSQNATSMAAYYNLTTQQWGASTQPNNINFNYGYCVANGEIYKLGSTFEKFTPAGDGTGIWSALSTTSGVTGAENSMVWDNGDYIYVNAGTGNPNTFVRYKISDGTWESGLNIPPIPRRYAGMAYVNGFIYRIGGLGETGGDLTLCSKYETATNTWSAIAPLPEVLNFSKWSVTTDGQYVFALGGGGGYSTYPLMPNVYYYNPATDTWTLDSNLPAPRGLNTGIFLPSVRKLFFGGGNNGTGGTVFQADNWEGTGGVYVPVELISFNAENQNGNLTIKWSTATETNNKGFSIESSTDKLSWTEKTFINGQGNSTRTSEYQYTEKNVVGKYFYRLKQVDYNGSFSYSKIIESASLVPDAFILNQNYPNPFNPSTKISFSIPEKMSVTLKVFDILGKETAVLVNEVKDKGTYEVNFESKKLTSGTYFYQLSAGSFSSVKKMIVLK